MTSPYPYGGGPALANLRAADVIRAIADAAERWSDADFPLRVRTLAKIVARTGYSEPVVEFALDALFEAIDARTISRTIEIELGSVQALDGGFFGNPARRFEPAGRVTIVSSDTTIGVALFPLVFALAAKCDVIVKDRSDDLIAAFKETLVEERPEFADALSVGAWDGAASPESDRGIAGAEVVVAFGGPALRAIRERCDPGARFVPYGHRTSIAYVQSDALHGTREAVALADRLARDIVLYDGEGCLSPHVVFVERHGKIEPSAFTRELALALDRAAIEFPVSSRAREAVHAFARGTAFRSGAGGESAPPRVLRSKDDAWLLVMNAKSEAPATQPGVAFVYEIEDPIEIGTTLMDAAGLVEAAGVADPARVGERLQGALTHLGVRRIATLGEMQRPALGGPHGGVARVLPFVRYVWHD